MRYCTFHIKNISRDEYNDIAISQHLPISDSKRPTGYARITHPMIIKSGQLLSLLLSNQPDQIEYLWVPGRSSITNAKQETLERIGQDDFYQELFDETNQRDRLVVAYRSNSVARLNRIKRATLRDEFTFTISSGYLELSKFSIRNENFGKYVFDEPIFAGRGWERILGLSEK